MLGCTSPHLKTSACFSNSLYSVHDIMQVTKTYTNYIYVYTYIRVYIHVYLCIMNILNLYYWLNGVISWDCILLLNDLYTVPKFILSIYTLYCPQRQRANTAQWQHHVRYAWAFTMHCPYLITLLPRKGQMAQPINHVAASVQSL